MTRTRSETIDVIALDADDTLWHNESFFEVNQAKFRHLIGPYVPALGPDELDKVLFTTETSNLRLFGYGAKGFTLSMIETAIQVTGGRVSASDIQVLIDLGKGMIDHPVELLDGVGETVVELAKRHRVMVITKGDLLHQEAKIAASGLGEHIWQAEIVTEKDPATYQRVLKRHGIDPDRFLMVGNSLKSDVLPVVHIGARAVHIPYHLLWAHEHVEPGDVGTYATLDKLSELPAWLAEPAD
ncbi:MAG: HAD family hydrolase [Acidimicrobiia bacterium]